MGIIQWDSKYEVNIRKIDKQHRKIVDILNNLYNLQDTRGSRKQMEKILNDLRSYITTHFETEESYIKERGCPGFDDQKKEHNAFIDTICAHQKDFVKGRAVTAINLFNYVWDWLAHHILTVDKKCLMTEGGAQ